MIDRFSSIQQNHAKKGNKYKSIIYLLCKHVYNKTGLDSQKLL